MLEYRTVVCHPFAWVCLFCWLGVHLCRYVITFRESAILLTCAGMLSLWLSAIDSTDSVCLFCWLVPVCHHFAWVCSFSWLGVRLRRSAITLTKSYRDYWLGVRLCRYAITLRKSARSVDLCTFVPVCYHFAWVCSFCWLVYVCAGLLSLWLRAIETTDWCTFVPVCYHFD